ncbi:uncharacterized protein METZ01_LOCUS262665, partial [marine metagenome]
VPSRGPPNGLLEGNGICEAEFGSGPRTVGHVPLRRPGGIRSPVDLDRHVARLGRHCPGQRGDVDGLARSDVVGTARLSAYEEGEQPDDEVGGVLVRPEGGAIAIDHDRATVECVSDEVAHREVGVDREVRPDEGEQAARDHLGVSCSDGCLTESFRLPLSPV